MKKTLADRNNDQVMSRYQTEFGPKPEKEYLQSRNFGSGHSTNLSSHLCRSRQLMNFGGKNRVEYIQNHEDKVLENFTMIGGSAQKTELFGNLLVGILLSCASLTGHMLMKQKNKLWGDMP